MGSSTVHTDKMGAGGDQGHARKRAAQLAGSPVAQSLLYV